MNLTFYLDSLLLLVLEAGFYYLRHGALFLVCTGTPSILFKRLGLPTNVLGPQNKLNPNKRAKQLNHNTSSHSVASCCTRGSDWLCYWQTSEVICVMFWFPNFFYPFSVTEVLIWSGIEKGPPRKEKFPEPQTLISALKAVL